MRLPAHQPSFRSCRGCNMTDLTVPDELNFSFIEEYIRTKTFSTGESHLDKGFKYFTEHYVHEVRVSSEIAILF